MPRLPPIVILLVAPFITTVRAQYTRSNEQAPAPLRVEMVKTGLFLISGGGTNSVLRLSANGLIIVDGKARGNYAALVEQAKKISDQPIRILINTDHHAAHTATNVDFLEDGTNIVVQQNAGKHLATPPTKTYDHEFTIRLGGIEAQLFHFGKAHTDGDTVVYFPNLKAIAVGDLFAAVPDPDYAAGGSLVEWGPVLDQILKLDFDTVIPASGPLVGRPELEAFRAKLGTLISRAADLSSKGVPKNQLMAQLKTGDLGWRLSYSGSRLDAFYTDLTSGK